VGLELNLTYETRRLLKVLLDAPTEEHYGLELAETAGLPIGSIYPILARLERAKWIEGAWEDIDPAREARRPRRYYRLTALGLRSARRVVDEVRSFFATKPVRDTR
jgi:PadR family transcriptional regulator, regulatory protein PadR